VLTPRRSQSTCRNHPISRFQLPTIRLTINRSRVHNGLQPVRMAGRKRESNQIGDLGSNGVALSPLEHQKSLRLQRAES
jgi:hypothetical protein